MKIIKRDRVRMNRAPATPAERRAAAAAQGHQTSARVIQENGRVVAVELTCACGDKTLLELDHDGALPPNT